MDTIREGRVYADLYGQANRHDTQLVKAVFSML